MAHFTENTAIRGCDPFNGIEGAVWIEVNIAAGFTREINILRGDLAIFRKLPNQGLLCQEASLSV